VGHTKKRVLVFCIFGFGTYISFLQYRHGNYVLLASLMKMRYETCPVA